MKKNNVMIIPAKPQRHHSSREKEKLRVAAYCRVSTETEEQNLSYDAQINHYTDYINDQNAGLVSDVFPGDAVAVGVHFNKGVPGYFADKFPVLLKRGFVNGR
jgi:site-specific DNA recombinase